jgi:hypothetical protein
VSAVEKNRNRVRYNLASSAYFALLQLEAKHLNYITLALVYFPFRCRYMSVCLSYKLQRCYEHNEENYIGISNFF